MKIAQHFRAFLETHNYLQLPQIEQFEVVGENPAAAENGHSRKWINFQADQNQTTDLELVDFISKNMKVESNITASDLICFISSIKEMLILGFEVEIPGVGYLHFGPGNILKFSEKNIYKKTIQKGWKRIPAGMSASFWL